MRPCLATVYSSQGQKEKLPLSLKVHDTGDRSRIYNAALYIAEEEAASVWELSMGGSLSA